MPLGVSAIFKYPTHWYCKAICSIHPSERAKLQCVACTKAKIHIAKSYHCSSRCFEESWPHHRVLHEEAASVLNEKGDSSSGTTAYPIAVTHKDNETWYEVGHSKFYIPATADIGNVLKFECVVVNAETKLSGHAKSKLTSRVIPAPSPTPRRLISVGDSGARISSDLTFSVLSYNILSESHATFDLYGYCPYWALCWSYRGQKLLREIAGYHADIVCLQEVPKDHFEEFAQELDKYGYEVLFRRKSTEVLTGNENTIDGCATFFHKDKFSLVKKYELEFNNFAQSFTDATFPAAERKNALKRMVKDNVALVLVLEAKFSPQGSNSLGKRQLVCVVNTNVYLPEELTDVKFWQVHTIVKGLEKIATSANIPIVVCGDLNSFPGSAPHALLARGRVAPNHPDMAVDPLGILQHLSNMTHNLPLVSAYSSFARTPAGPAPENQRKKMDLTTNEPLSTKWSKGFPETCDYIFYSADSLRVEGLLDLLDNDRLTNLPSPEWPSNHIALLAVFSCKAKKKTLTPGDSLMSSMNTEQHPEEVQTPENVQTPKSK
ncbi:hypothetical protein Leryth_015363 [Lithospermum erythrorhizon]|nr:hypothetical protein Leryth_015363 [Lithospermum erythrorhizon]